MRLGDRLHARHDAGFTLIEILITVAIISILAAIAVPNFLEAQTRAKVSRVLSDHRVLATALESYHVDNNFYPLRQKFPVGNVQGAGNALTRAEEMRWLTSPIAYISSLPIDVFENRIAAPNNLLDYWSPVIVQHLRRTLGIVQPADGTWYTKNQYSRETWDYGWVLVSVGPDKHLGGRIPNFGNYGIAAPFTHWNVDYDPTNGTLSLGNIYRFHKNGATAHNAFRRP